MSKLYTITSDQPMNLDRFLTTESNEVSLDKTVLFKEAEMFCSQVEEFQVSKVYTIDLTRYGFGVQTLREDDPLIKCVEEVELDQEAYFWDFSPELRHIRQYSLYKMVSPWSVLGAVLAQVVAAVPPNVVLPGFTGGVGSLNLFIANVARSGGGKDASKAVAEELLDLGLSGYCQYITEIATGQGLVGAFVDNEKVDGKYVTKQIRQSVLGTIAEIDSFDHYKQSGSNTSATLRAMWSGSKQGGQIKDKSKFESVEAHSYRLCLLVHVQPGRGGSVMSERDGGLPQRFVWLPAVDESVKIANRPNECPGQLHVRFPFVQSPMFGALGDIPQTDSLVLNVCPEIEYEVLMHREQQNQPDYTEDELNSHLIFSREKLCAGLAFLHGSKDLTKEYWDLSSILMRKSIEARSLVVDVLTAKAEQVYKDREVREVSTELAKEKAKEKLVEDRKFEEAGKVATTIARKLTAKGWVSRKELRNALSSKDRKLIDEGLAYLMDSELLQIRDVPGTSQAGKEYQLR